jgi:acyl dehydratase
MALDLSCVGRTSGPYTNVHEDRDVLHYALSVGAGTGDLRWAFEGHPRFAVLPGFAVIPATGALFEAVRALGADLRRLLHGEQEIRWFAPIPPQGRLVTTWDVPAVYDKGKGALAVVRARTADEGGTPLFENLISLYIRGEGGFGGDRGPEAWTADPPDRAPDFRADDATLPTQALLYRLNGDRNFLHADPEFAKAAGFERPILHGLCTLGFALRTLVDRGLGGDPARLKAVRARFAGVVYPGDRIVTEGWQAGDGRVVLRVTTGRGTPAIVPLVAEVA